MVTPHILVHQRLESDETHQLTVNLEPRRYRIRTQQQRTARWLDIVPSTDQINIIAHSDRLEIIQPEKALDQPVEEQPISFEMTNQALYAQRLFIENADWYANAVNAAQVTSLQHFRDLFSDEVLRPGDEIGVSGMTILFSDLVGSTAMYNQWGDASSYAVVRAQFAFLQEVVRLSLIHI